MTLAIGIGLTSVLIRREGLRHATAATINTNDAKSNRLDTVYIGRMPETGKTKAKHQVRHIVCIADGARDLWRYFRRKYPNTINVVDL